MVKLNKKNKFSLFVIFVFLFFLFIPWNSTIKMPAIIESKNYYEYYPLEDAYIEDILFSNGDIVKKSRYY